MEAKRVQVFIITGIGEVFRYKLNHNYQVLRVHPRHRVLPRRRVRHSLPNLRTAGKKVNEFQAQKLTKPCLFLVASEFTKSVQFQTTFA